MKKLSNTEAKFIKSVAYIKKKHVLLFRPKQHLFVRIQQQYQQ